MLASAASEKANWAVFALNFARSGEKPGSLLNSRKISRG